MDSEVRHALARARTARAEGAAEKVLEALREAAGAARDDADVQIVGWRLAKGIYDFGTADQLMDALEPALRTASPFAHYPTAVAAAEPIAKRVWDTLGYHDTRVLEMWQAYSQHQRDRGDPWLAAMGDVQRAWQFACVGAVAEVRSLTDHYANLTPRRFGRGPTKHPDAWDTTLSLYWVQADMARTLLRASTWTGNEPQALEGRELFLDALGASERTPSREFWYLDPVSRAADRFGWTSDTWAPWSRAVSRLEDVHPVQTEIALGVLHRRAARTEAAVTAFESAAEVAAQAASGWEWVADAWTERLRTREDASTRARLEQLIEQRHLLAFR